jgi:hypothetical protein
MGETGPFFWRRKTEKKEMWYLMKLLEYQRGGADSERYKELSAQITPEEYERFTEEVERERLSKEKP